MNLPSLLTNLNNPQPGIRLSVAQVLGLVEETRALAAVGQQYKAEDDPTVRQALAWAGKRLHTAHQRGYQVVEEIFEHFGVNREIANLENAVEAEILRKMQEDFEFDMVNRKERAAAKKAAWGAAAGLAGMAMGGAAMGMGMMGAALAPGADVMSSNLGTGPRAEAGKSRAPAPRPANTNIDNWLRRLKQNADPKQRQQAAVELATVNNPAALPHLAVAYLTDTAPAVKEAASKYGKILYWKALYWQMEQDGSLQAEINRRVSAWQQEQMRNAQADETPSLPAQSGQPAPPPPPAGNASPPNQQEDISDILRRAEQARQRRNKRT